MAIVKAFNGVRYNLEKVLLKQVITPPYDVINEKMREDFLHRSPYNIVRIDLPQGKDDRYKVAGEEYRKWVKDGILQKDKECNFYLYEQVYNFDGKTYMRSGFFGLIKLSEFGNGVVFPHEKTHAGPKVDRYELMKASNANFSSIFGLYLDNDNKLKEIFEDVKKSLPDESALDDSKVKHSIWRINSAEDIKVIEQFMQDKSIYIADGHHRYETAVIYRDDMRKAEGVSIDVERPYDYALMMFVNFNDEGLKVFPTHRIIDVDETYTDEKLVYQLNKTFTVERVLGRDKLDKFLNDNKDKAGSFGFIGLDGVYTLKVKKDVLNQQDKMYKKVSTYILETLILKDILEFTDDKLSHKDGIHFMQTYGDIDEYKVKHRAIAFILNAESLDVIRELSEAGLVMPQKSTYFYPKLATGLLINELQ